MPDIAKTSSRPAPILRRGLDLVFFSAIGLLIAAVVSWFFRAPSFPAETMDSSRFSNVQPTAHEPGGGVASEPVRFPDYGQELSALLREADSPARTRAVLDALQVWADVDPGAVTVWVHSQALDFTGLLTELFATAKMAPRDAVLLADRFVRADATMARDCGYALIFGLNRRGEFSASAGYATTAPEGVRRDLVIAAYHDWGRRQPEQAFLAAAQVADTTARQFAMQSVFSGWARSSPEELAETALSFPDGDEKSAALTKALRAWMIKDPWKAGDWILDHKVAVPVAENFFARDER